ncbi:protein LNK1-like isoform X1 [Sesamum indicum]|uniref:Protein LNK1-like isoform X1 n=2 Tax=Sesamum indicum TaxID=4182 RepID=A0A6I9TVW1_SESIN|nr:protein LNK1-like isoform X1 [Sesamum indicum]
MLEVMSELCMYEFEDIVWDELCHTDDRLVPHPESEQPGYHSILGDSHKKLCRETTSISNHIRDRTTARYVDQGRELQDFSSLSKRRNMMLDKDSWPHGPSDIFHSSSDSASIKEASSLASENATSSSHALKRNNADKKGSEVCGNDTLLGDKTTTVDNNSFNYPLGDITHTGNNLEFFDNTEDKDSSDFLYYGWPEIGNFEDVDRMFRSCDSTFGLGASKEDELGWFSSTDNIGGSGDVVNADVNRFPCPESNLVETISENHDSSRTYSVNDSAMTSAHVSYKDTSWTSEKSDLYASFVNGLASAETEDGFIHKKQVNEHKKHFKLQNQSVGKRKEHYFGNGSFSYMNNPSNEVVQLPSEATTHQALQQQASSPDSYNYLQNPLSYLPSDNTQLSDPTSVNPNISGVKSENNDLTSPSPRNSSNTSNQLPTMESSHDSPFQVTAPAGRGKREKLHSRHSSRSSGTSSLKNANVMVQAAIGDPGSTGKQVHCYGDKVENHSDIEGVSFVIPTELGSSNIQESSTMSPGVNDISLEAASFRQLQLVMEQLDLRTKLCIRDSLYRLARSAEQRHNHAKFNGGCGEERDASGAFLAEGTNHFMDMETDTNPIDRSIAHLLFHRPSESHAVPAHDSLPFKSPGAVHGSLTSPPIVVDNLVNCEEAASEIEKLSDR